MASLGQYWAILIQGFTTETTAGSPGTTRRFRIANGVPTGDVDNVYMPFLRGFPKEFKIDVDWRTGNVDLSGGTFELGATPWITERFMRHRHASIAQITTEIVDASDTTVQTNSTVLEGKTLFLKRENIYFHTHSGGGLYDVERGRSQTVARRHRVGDGQDVSLFDASLLPVYKGMNLKLVKVPRDGGYDDEETVADYIIERIWMPDDITVRIETVNALQLLERRYICQNLWRGRLLMYGGQGDYSFGSYQADPRTNRRPLAMRDNVDSQDVLFSVDGKTAAVAEVEQQQSGFGRGNVNVLIANDSPLLGDGATIGPFGDSTAKWPGQITELFSTHPQAPGNTVIVPQPKDKLPFSSHVCELTLQILLTTATGENKPAGGTNYDLGFPDLGIGIDHTRVDIAAIEQLVLDVPEAVQESLFFPLDGKPIEVYPFLKKILRVHNLVLAPDQSGKLTILRLLELQEANALLDTITDSIYAAKPSQARRDDLVGDKTEISYRDRPGKGTITETFEAPVISERLGGGGLTIIVDAPGVSSQAQAESVAIDHATRYNKPIPFWSILTTRTINKWIGDLVFVTSNRLFFHDGTRGVTSAIAQIQGRQFDQEKNVIRYDLHWTSFRYDRIGWIAPALEVLSWDGPTKTITAVANQFASGDGPYTNDVEAFRAGDRVKLQDPDLSSKVSMLEIASVDVPMAKVVLTTEPAPAPAAGDILLLSNYDTYLLSTVVMDWAFMADSAATPPDLGSGSDDAFEWVL